MPYPRVTDDGLAVEIDLHGATVSEAEGLVRRLVTIAARRGRSTIRVIHGASTSESGIGHTTIRSRLFELLEEGELSPEVTDWFSFDVATTLSLAAAGRRDDRRLTMSDLL